MYSRYYMYVYDYSVYLYDFSVTILMCKRNFMASHKTRREKEKLMFLKNGMTQLMGSLYR